MADFDNLPEKLSPWGDDTNESSSDDSDVEIQKEDSDASEDTDSDASEDTSSDETDITDFESNSSEYEFNKINEELEGNVLADYHPELIKQSYDEIKALCVCVRNKNNRIIDPLHKTVPFLTKYERAKILGVRANQINNGVKPMVDVDENILSSHTIAEMELEKKKIPFIICRPLPNGGCEYWKVEDLEILY